MLYIGLSGVNGVIERQEMISPQGDRSGRMGEGGQRSFLFSHSA